MPQSYIQKWGLILGGVATVLILFFGALFARVSHRGQSTNPPLSNKVAAASTIKHWTGVLPLEVAEAFARAKTQEERLKWVRYPTKVSDLMADFYRSGPGEHEEVLEVRQSSTVYSGAEAFEPFTVVMTDQTTRVLCVVVSDGEAKVDFKSYARYGSESWDAMLTGHTREAREMRVFVNPACYYNFNFADDQKWQCFVATSPDLADPVYLYLPRNNSETKNMARHSAVEAIPMTLAISAVGDSYRMRQFEISRLMQGSWVAAEP